MINFEPLYVKTCKNSIETRENVTRLDAVETIPNTIEFCHIFSNFETTFIGTGMNRYEIDHPGHDATKV